MKNKWLAFLYFLNGILFIIAKEYHWDFILLPSKSLIIILLSLFILSNLLKNKLKIHPFLAMALFFSFWGDFFLELPGNPDLYFMLGLGSFLLAQISYIALFFKISGFFKPDVFSTGIMILFTVSIIILLLSLNPRLGDLKLPVYVYGISLWLMVISSASFYARNKSLFLLVSCLGAGLFFISDASIAYNKFHTPLEHSTLLIMSTYIIAQFMITYGYTKHLLNSKTP